MSDTLTYERQYRRCNKRGCSTCRHGPGHGPYWYAYWRGTDGKLRSRYVGKRKHPEEDGPPGQQAFIYALCEPDLWQEVRYIGVSLHPFRRLASHLSPSHLTGRTPKVRWLRGLQTKHLTPVLVILEETYAADPYYIERKWISHYHQQGARLTNVCGKHLLAA